MTNLNMIRSAAILAVLGALFGASLVLAQVPVDGGVATPPEEMTADPVQESDTTSPMIVSWAVVSAEPTSVTIMWTTDEPSRGRIEYGPTTQYGSVTDSDAALATSHTKTISGLTPNTTLHFRIIVTDEAGNAGYSPDYTATTASEPVLADEDPPAISEITVSDITLSAATISFSADELVQSYIEYGPTSAYGFTTPVSSEYSDSQSFLVSGLNSDTTYYYRIIAEDEAGNMTTTLQKNFSTLEPEPASQPEPKPEPEPTPAEPTPEPEPAPEEVLPVISGVKVQSVTESGAVIVWTTNIAVKSKIEYGLTTAYGTVWRDDTSRKDHSATLSGLSAGRLYNFRVSARDGSGSTAVSKNYQFTTTASASAPIPAPAPAPVPKPIVIKQLPVVVSGAPSTLPTSPTRPLIFKTEALDSQVAFFWLRDFSDKPGIQVRIIRKLGSATMNINDGEVVFDGNGKSFTDTNLANGTKYHYGIFAYDDYGRFSQIVRMTATPKSGDDQVIFDATPEASNRAEVAFARDLYRGLRGDDVKNLQEFLIDEGHYPEALITGYFGPLTKAALSRFQASQSIAPVAGYFGPITRARIQLLQKASAIGF